MAKLNYNSVLVDEALGLLAQAKTELASTDSDIQSAININR